MIAYVSTPTVEQARKIIRLIAERNGRKPRIASLAKPRQPRKFIGDAYAERKMAKAKSVTRMHLAYDAASETGMSVHAMLHALDVMLDFIVESVANGDEVRIRGAMTFYGKIRKPRPARNIRTGEVVPLLERRVMLCRFPRRRIPGATYTIHEAA